MTLKEFGVAYTRKKYQGSSVPEHARPIKKFSENGANELTNAILAYFEYIGWKASRQSSEGRYIPGKEYTDVIGKKHQHKGVYIPRAKAAKGCGDIRVIMPPHGRTLEIEVKYGSDRQSPDQKKYQKDLEAMGGIYMIAKTWDGFMHQISKYTAETST